MSSATTLPTLPTATALASDQLIRNARIGLRETGWFQEDLLFDEERRDFVLILLAPTTGNPLVENYRDVNQLRTAIPSSDRLHHLPRLPFTGELGYRDVIDLLGRQRRWFAKSERILIDDLVRYLEFKLTKGNGQSH